MREYDISEIPKDLLSFFEPADGLKKREPWILRQKIIWVKGISFCDTYAGSCMPDSAKDRFNKNGFEPLYFFTKTGDYYFEQQYEGATETNEARPRMGQGNQTQYNQKASEIYNGQSQKDYKFCGIYTRPRLGSGGGTKRILRNVWAINPEPSKEKHYAAYPTALVEPCIKAGCPKEICVKCGKPRMPIYKKTGGSTVHGSWADHSKDEEQGTLSRTQAKDMTHDNYEQSIIDYSCCSCSAGFRPGVILDPFGGTGTTGAVAVKLKRDYILIEGKQEYIDDIANLKLQEAETGVTVEEQRQGQKALFV
jgi:hypothetical protein